MIATTKERLKFYLEQKGISNSQFYSDLGIKRGLLDADKLKATIADPIIAKILVIYTDLNIAWLLTGEGPMLRDERSEGIIHEDPQVPTPKPDESILYNMYKDLMEEKKEKEKKIEQLTNELRAMERKVGTLEAELKHTATLGNRTAEPVSTAKRSSQSKAFATFVSAPSSEYESR